MSDLISRQAAIDAIRASTSKYTGFMEMEMYTDDDAVEAINGVPSAQPEIIRCKDCKNWDTEWQNDWAKNYHYCPMIDGTRAGDWFCADAERKEDG